MSLIIASHQPPEASVILLPAWLALAFAFALGAVLGSFLNVVAYRLPRGLSLSHPPSQCVKCGQPIRWHDNIPILGWLLLGGRCRDCGARFSVRYALVEAGVAIAFLILAWIELAAPGRWQADGVASVGTLALARFAFRAVLVCSLVAVALIELDGFAPPRGLLWCLLAAGLILSLLWPALNELPIIGAAGGLLFGGLAWPAANSKSAGVSRGLDGIVLLASVGAFLGSTAVGPVATSSVLIQLIALLYRSRAPGPNWFVSLPLATILGLAARTAFAESMRSNAENLGWTVAWGVATTCVALTVHLVTRAAPERRAARPLEASS